MVEPVAAPGDAASLELPFWVLLGCKPPAPGEMREKPQKGREDGWMYVEAEPVFLVGIGEWWSHPCSNAS